MSLRPRELAEVAAELNQHLAGAAVQKAHAPSAGRVWLELRQPGKSLLLHLCAAPQLGRLSIVEERPKGSPGEASGFQHLLRQQLTGARLVTVEAEGQRASLHFVRDEHQLALHLELSAPPAILLTVAGREEPVTGAHGKKASEGRERPPGVAGPSQPAKRKGGRAPPRTAPSAPESSVLPSNSSGSTASTRPNASGWPNASVEKEASAEHRASPEHRAAASEGAAGPAPSDAARTGALSRLRILAVSAPAPVPERSGAPLVTRTGGASAATSRLTSERLGAPSVPRELTAGAGPDLPLARAAEALFATVETTRALDDARAPLLAKLKRLEKTRKNVEADAARTTLASRHRADGELLKLHLAAVPRGSREVTLPETLADGSVAERVVKLDPARTPQQNVEWMFHQFKRLTRGAELSRQRLEQLDRERALIEQQLAEAIAAPAEIAGPPRRKQEQTSRPFREYLGHQGARIWVGKGSADNDTLSFHLARPHHLWLHARGVTGAHVVIPLERGAAASQELLLDAAHLALHHSEAKGERRGEVSYVPVKHLRKVKGAPGAVTFSQEKTFVLRVEPDRLRRLLASET